MLLFGPCSPYTKIEIYIVNIPSISDIRLSLIGIFYKIMVISNNNFGQIEKEKNIFLKIIF